MVLSCVAAVCAGLMVLAVVTALSPPWLGLKLGPNSPLGYILVTRAVGHGPPAGAPAPAELVSIGPVSVAGYVKTVYSKLSISNRAEAALEVEARRRGLV